MKNLNQKTINKILAGFILILIALTVFIAQQKITEQTRVEYYICYERMVNNSSRDTEEELQFVKDYCNGLYDYD